MTRVDTHLLLIVSDEAIRRFCLLTALGFNVEISAACTLRRFLCDRLQIEPDYLETRIQTVFLNFRAVDDPDAAMVTAGSTVGLSGPMPGIAGATLRRGSPLASMRGPISHVADGLRSPSQAGDVTVRLFNVIQQELGPCLLARGIRVTGEALQDLLCHRADLFGFALCSAQLDGKAISASALFAADWTGRTVCLQVSGPA